MSTTPAVVPQALDMMGFSGQRSENLKAEEKLKMAIVGEPGVGKSWFGATAPQPIRLYDFDDRASSLAGKPGLLIKSRPTMTDIETDLSIAKAKKIQGQPIPTTWMFDSMTFMQRAMEEEIFRQSTDSYKEVKVGAKLVMRIRKGWDAINGIQRYVEYLISEFSPLGNVIFVFHEKPEKDQARSAPDKPAYTGDITIDPQYLANCLSLFNERFRIKITHTGAYEVQCKFNTADQKFNAITTMNLGITEKPDIQAMLAKHKAAIGKP